MCEAKPGCRCATDTRDGAVATLERYEATHPQGPAVDPLTAATMHNPSPHEAAALIQYEERARQAQAELADMQAAHQEAARAVADLRAERLTFATEAREIRNGIDPHERAGRQHAEVALQRARDLYLEHGANPRLVGYYVSDMRETAGLAPAEYDPTRRTDPRSQFLAARDLRMKTKPYGPDAGPTKAAAAAAESDQSYTSATAAFDAERQSALALEAQAQSVENAMRRSDQAFTEALRREGAAQERLNRARQDAYTATEGIERARERVSAGVPVDGQARLVDNTLRGDIFVGTDGATNLWRYERATAGKPAQYERLHVRTSRESGTTHLVTSDGRKVRHTTHYANFKSTKSNPEVWVAPAADGARPAGEAAERLQLEVVIDSGG